MEDKRSILLLLLGTERKCLNFTCLRTVSRGRIQPPGSLAEATKKLRISCGDIKRPRKTFHFLGFMVITK